MSPGHLGRPRQLGMGLGFRLPLADAIRAHSEDIDWLELQTEQYLPFTAARARYLRDRVSGFPVALHGSDMSIASDTPVDVHQIEDVKNLADELDSAWVSDHICFTHEDEIYLGHLTPTPWTVANAKRIAEKARTIQDILERPFLLENIAYDFVLAKEIYEAEFITEIVASSGCGLLLDVANIYANSVNHDFDPYDFIDHLPLEHVGEIHIAGGRWDNGKLADSHDHPVPDSTWELLSYVCRLADAGNVLLERDDRFPDEFDEISADLQKARGIMSSVRTSR
jgi:uncharacterized protein